MQPRFRVFLDGKMYYPEDEDHPDVFFYITQDGHVGAFPKMMGERFDPVLYQDAVETFFTGRKDRNGKDIYAGDILEFDLEGWRYEPIGEVGWYAGNPEWPASHDGWGMVGVGCDFYEITEWGKVIGNIHEDKELLECL